MLQESDQQPVLHFVFLLHCLASLLAACLDYPSALHLVRRSGTAPIPSLQVKLKDLPYGICSVSSELLPLFKD